MRAVTGDLEGVKKYFNAMKEANLRPDGFSRAILIDALGDAGDVEGAMNVELLPEDDVPRRILLRISSDHGDVKATKKVLAAWKNKKPHNELTLLRAHAKANAWGKAAKFYRSQPVSIDAATAYTKVLGESGKIETTRLVIEEALNSGVTPTEELLTSLIDANGNSGNLAGAERVLLEMKDRFNIEPDIASYTALIGVQTNLEGCERVLENMLAAGLLPAETTFRVMWSVAVADEDLDGAVNVMEKMRTFGYVPHVSFYNRLIVGFGNRRDLVKVESLVSAMRKNEMKPSVVTYNALLDAFGKTLRSPVAAERLLKDMLQAGVDPDLITYNTLAAVYARAADPDGVSKVLERMAKVGFQPDKFTYSSVIIANRRAGRSAEAQAASEEARRKGFL